MDRGWKRIVAVTVPAEPGGESFENLFAGSFVTAKNVLDLLR